MQCIFFCEVPRCLSWQTASENKAASSLEAFAEHLSSFLIRPLYLKGVSPAGCSIPGIPALGDLPLNSSQGYIRHHLRNNNENHFC